MRKKKPGGTLEPIAEVLRTVYPAQNREHDSGVPYHLQGPALSGTVPQTAPVSELSGISRKNRNSVTVPHNFALPRIPLQSENLLESVPIALRGQYSGAPHPMKPSLIPVDTTASSGRLPIKTPAVSVSGSHIRDNRNSFTDISGVPDTQTLHPVPNKAGVYTVPTTHAGYAEPDMSQPVSSHEHTQLSLLFGAHPSTPGTDEEPAPEFAKATLSPVRNQRTGIAEDLRKPLNIPESPAENQHIPDIKPSPRSDAETEKLRRFEANYKHDRAKLAKESPALARSATHDVGHAEGSVGKKTDKAEVNRMTADFKTLFFDELESQTEL